MSKFILTNPPKPHGALITGFVEDSYRLDLLPGYQSEPLPENVAKAALKTFSFLTGEEVNTDPTIPNGISDIKIIAPDPLPPPLEGSGVKVGETPLEGLKGLGEKTINKLHEHEIYSREQFFELKEKDPEYFKKIVGHVVYAKFE